MFGLATSAGVGFTVALFVTSLSFDTAASTDAAKVGILAGSTLAGIIGFTILRTTPAATERPDGATPEPAAALAPRRSDRVPRGAWPRDSSGNGAYVGAEQ
jgi:hypothetical protein